MDKCDCLTEYDSSLPHYVHCALVGTEVIEHVNTPARTLAELASQTDIDTALTCLRELTA